MPGIAPRIATPAKHAIDSQNSQRWTAIDSPEVPDLEQADGRGDHDSGKSRVRQVLEQVRRDEQQHAIATAPTTLVSCVLAPAARRPACATSCC
jgi:hypothetical protein